MSISNLNKAEIFANVDGNRVATARQLYAVGRHFGKIHGADSTEAFRFSKVFSAILLKFQNEHEKTPITHSDVSRMLEGDAIPKKFVNMITSSKPKAAPKRKKVIKTSAPKKAEKATKTTAAKKIQADASELSEFQARFDAITKRQDATDKKLATLEAKLDIVMAYLETDPDA